MLPRTEFPRRTLAVLALLCTASCTGTPATGELPREPGTGTVSVTVEGFKSAEGQALVALFLSADGFPGDVERAHEARELPIEEGRVSVTFEEVPAGPFAISVFHDKDADFELDSGLFGIPSEKWGVSRDAGGFLGPPSFGQAELHLSDGELQSIVIPLG